ncbi:hypothetical protein [Anaeromicropila populeti]|uniref:Uncharacterized protein n=1 Tax=Anaeromicropila populeti TaxID=37658 RepID=A0A1I6K6D1_9FIRM|nr:hypothetical protein [Anaeromicropila populeti]SFR86782.1 hypothetical protein SAMN05661086_02228 [Anaeromicropila populeti]
MAKAGMRRPDPKEPHGTESNKKMHTNKNEQPPVPEIQGKAKYGHEKAGTVNAPNWARDDYKSSIDK